MNLALRATLAFIALPGVVAFVVPCAWLWATPLAKVRQPWGGVLWGVGAIGLLWCTREFYAAGRGTLAPWAPPQRLVTRGLYRWCRNPMYVAVLCLLAGWAWTFGSRPLAWYAAAVAVAFHLRVVWGEEPVLARRFGDEWTRYRSRTPRWLIF